MKLIDLDTCNEIDSILGPKYSSAYLPPEFIHVVQTDREAKMEVNCSQPVTVALDMWSFGIVLYELCANEPFFLSAEECGQIEKHYYITENTTEKTSSIILEEEKYFELGKKKD